MTEANGSARAMNGLVSMQWIRDDHTATMTSTSFECRTPPLSSCRSHKPQRGAANRQQAMTDLPTELPFGDEEDGGTSSAATKEDGDDGSDATTTTRTSSIVTLDDEQEDRAGRPAEVQGPERPPGSNSGGSKLSCCECAAHAFLATLAVTYVVTSVLVVMRYLVMLVYVVPTAFIVLWFVYLARQLPRRIHRSALASAAFFFIDTFNLVLVTGSSAPLWVLAGVWVLVILGVGS